MMLLTNKEESELKEKITKPKTVQDTKYDTKKSQFCGLGHKLNYVYWRSHIEKRLGKIQGLYYCPKCEKLYQTAITEISFK